MRRTWIGSRMVRNGIVVGVTSAMMWGLAMAQNPPQPEPKGAEPPAARGKAKGKGPVAPAGAVPKNRRGNVDPLAGRAVGGAAPAIAPAMVPPAWPYRYKLRIAGGDGSYLAASYYPAKPTARFNAPVVLMIHDRGPGRAGKDFEEPLDELKGQSLAESLQEQGYAVLVPDLRGQGQNPRHEVNSHEWQAMPTDLQAAYEFLVDRHNRGEFNLAKLGVVAMGDGANLAAAWAATPGAAVSSEGRVSDLSALILLSPVADALGLKLQTLLAPIAPRIPIYLACGDRDHASVDAVKAAQTIVERQPRSKVAFFDSALHGYKLLAFYNKAPGAITRFLDDPVKGRVIDWEPRFLLNPVGYQSEGTVETNTVARKNAVPKKAAN